MEEDNVFGPEMPHLSLRELLNRSAALLAQAGIEDARFDARQLLMAALSMDTAHFLLTERQSLQELFPAEEARRSRCACWLQYLHRRLQREPLQQILGETEFYGLPFKVTADVLCPRQDTETLVDKVLSDYKNVDKQSLALLDLCTGSGCIGISLAKIGGFGRGLCVDISEKALSVARENAERILGPCGQLAFQQGDLFCGVRDYLEAKALAGFDVIVSNPPYIRSEVVDTLEPEVRDYEPRIALDGTADGLHFYRRIAGEAMEYLLPGGGLYLEIGYDQGAAVRALLEQNGFSGVTVLKDYGGNDRVVTGRRK